MHTGLRDLEVGGGPLVVKSGKRHKQRRAPLNYCQVSAKPFQHGALSIFVEMCKTKYLVARHNCCYPKSNNIRV